VLDDLREDVRLAQDQNLVGTDEVLILRESDVLAKVVGDRAAV
jgi:hypothetical protein